MGQRVSSPSLAERHLFQERPCKVFPLDEELNHFFLFQARFWRKLEVRQHGGWLGKDLQVQRRCKWGEFQVLSSKLSQSAHFKAFNGDYKYMFTVERLILQIKIVFCGIFFGSPFSN